MAVASSGPGGGRGRQASAGALREAGGSGGAVGAEGGAGHMSSSRQPCPAHTCAGTHIACSPPHRVLLGCGVSIVNSCGNPRCTNPFSK